VTKEEFDQFIEEKLLLHGSYERLAQIISNREKTKPKNNPEHEDIIYSAIHMEMLLDTFTIEDSVIKFCNKRKSFKEVLKKHKIKAEKKYGITPNRKKYYFEWIDKKKAEGLGDLYSRAKEQEKNQDKNLILAGISFFFELAEKEPEKLREILTSKVTEEEV